MRTLVDSEDPDKIPHKVVFQQGLAGLLNYKRSAEEKIQKYLDIITGELSMDHTVCIVPNQK